MAPRPASPSRRSAGDAALRYDNRLDPDARRSIGEAPDLSSMGIVPSNGDRLAQAGRQQTSARAVATGPGRSISALAPARSVSALRPRPAAAPARGPNRCPRHLRKTLGRCHSNLAERWLFGRAPTSESRRNQFGLRSAPIGFLRIASTAREISFHIGPESCAGGREAVREALTGERAGRPPAFAGAAPDLIRGPKTATGSHLEGVAEQPSRQVVGEARVRTALPGRRGGAHDPDRRPGLRDDRRARHPAVDALGGMSDP
jgi:hypothetical protein